jgi:hypothetical protein
MTIASKTNLLRMVFMGVVFRNLLGDLTADYTDSADGEGD